MSYSFFFYTVIFSFEQFTVAVAVLVAPFYRPFTV